MERLSALARFKSTCPFLGRTKTSTLRTLCTSTSPRYPSISKLTEKATKCPVMGPALNTRSSQIVAGFASVAGNVDVQKMHHGKSLYASGDIGKCPHASAALSAARMADDLAAAAAAKQSKAKAEAAAAKAKEAAGAGCPFHQKAQASTSAAAAGGFNYEHFYAKELDKKHSDKSYRYFNNINRLAKKFPVAHTAKVTEEVEVWCANDYLGMGNNPVVLETMQ